MFTCGFLRKKTKNIWKVVETGLVERDFFRGGGGEEG